MRLRLRCASLPEPSQRQAAFHPLRTFPIADGARRRVFCFAMVGMRIFKSLLVLLIGLTALMYVLQNLAHVGAMRQQIEATASISASPTASWAGFGFITACQLALAATAFKGAWNLFATRHGSPDQFKEAKTTVVWSGGLALLSWFTLSLLVGAGLFQWGTDSGELALAKSFALGTTSALTILFVWGTTD